MITSILVLFSPTFQTLSPAKSSEMLRVFQSLINISKPTNLEKINADLNDGRVSAVRNEDSSKRVYWTLGSGYAQVNFTARGDFRGYGCLHVPREQKVSRTDAELIAETKTVLSQIGFWGDNVSFQVARTPGSNTRVSALPSIRGMQCTHDATFEFQERSGHLESVFFWDRLDYQKYLDAPHVTPDQAMAAALIGYGGFHPFSAALVEKPTLFFGIPASAELYDPAFHEITEAQMKEFRSYVAMPLYYINIECVGEPNAYGDAQTIVVDALTGRPIVIYPRGNRHRSQSTKKWTVGDTVDVSSPQGQSLGVAKRSHEGKATGLPVWVKIGGLLIDAQYEAGAKKLWIGGNRAYIPSSKLARYLARNAASRRSFGKRS